MIKIDDLAKDVVVEKIDDKHFKCFNCGNSVEIVKSKFFGYAGSCKKCKAVTALNYD